MMILIVIHLWKHVAPNKDDNRLDTFAREIQSQGGSENESDVY
jgi:hypothetical protein